MGQIHKNSCIHKRVLVEEWAHLRLLHILLVVGEASELLPKYTCVSDTGIPRNSLPSQFVVSLIRDSLYVYHTSQFVIFASQIRDFLKNYIIKMQ